MALAATLLTLLSALEHTYFFLLESVLWRKPLGRKTFRMDEAKAEATAQLALNQGFYNLFLAVGLAWSALTPNPTLRIYTLLFVIGAAIVGGITVSMRILVVQGAPAALALVFSLMGR